MEQLAPKSDQSSRTHSQGRRWGSPQPAWCVCVWMHVLCVCVCVSIHRVLEGSSPGQTAISSFLSVLAAACVVVCGIVPTDCIPCELQGQQQRTVGPPSTGQGCSRVHKYELLHPVNTEPYCGGFYHLVKSNYPYRNRKYLSQLWWPSVELIKKNVTVFSVTHRFHRKKI